MEDKQTKLNMLFIIPALVAVITFISDYPLVITNSLLAAIVVKLIQINYRYK